MGLAPAPGFPERTPTTYEVNQVPGTPSGPGPLYFEEGLGTDVDLPSNFQTGVLQGYETPPGRANHNQNVYIKDASETMRERAHVGSAAWVEAPTMLSDFASGSFSDAAQVRYESANRSGGRQARPNPAVVSD